MSKSYMQQRGETIRFNEAELAELVGLIRSVNMLNETERKLLAKFEKSLIRIRAKQDG